MDINYNFKYLIEEIFKIFNDNFLLILPILAFPIVFKFILKFIYTLPFNYVNNDYDENNNYEKNNECVIDDDKFNYGFFRK